MEFVIFILVFIGILLIGTAIAWGIAKIFEVNDKLNEDRDAMAIKPRDEIVLNDLLTKYKAKITVLEPKGKGRKSGKRKRKSSKSSTVRKRRTT